MPERESTVGALLPLPFERGVQVPLHNSIIIISYFIKISLKFIEAVCAHIKFRMVFYNFCY